MWVIAVDLQLNTGDAAMGEQFNKKYWLSILPEMTSILPESMSKKGEELEEALVIPHAGSLQDVEAERRKSQRQSLKVLSGMQIPFSFKFRMPNYIPWFLRAGMDWVINGVCRSLVMYTFPLMLCVEDPLDFVKDAMAVLFITTLDDMPNAKPLVEMSFKFKFAIHYYRSLRGETDEEPGHEQLTMTPDEKEYVEENDEKFIPYKQYGPRAWAQVYDGKDSATP